MLAEQGADAVHTAPPFLWEGSSFGRARVPNCPSMAMPYDMTWRRRTMPEADGAGRSSRNDRWAHGPVDWVTHDIFIPGGGSLAPLYKIAST